MAEAVFPALLQGKSFLGQLLTPLFVPFRLRRLAFPA